MNENKTMLRRSFTVTAAHHNLSAEFLEPSTGSHTGDLPTLVFLHEGLGCIPLWRNFPSLLCEKTGCPALIYDRWGYGTSDPLPAVGPRVPSYLHEEAFVSLPEVLKQCNIDDAVLIGHSDGGSMALMYAAVYPDTVRGIITEAAHVFVEEITLKGIREAVEIYKRTDLKAKLTKYHGNNTEKMFYGWADTWLSPEFRDWNIEEFLPRIISPLLVLQGADDIYGTPAQVEAIADQVAGPVKSRLVPNCGHIPHHEATDEVLNEMTEFIRDLIAQNHQ
jgi:pimeloyl-ACP methyl ester carboxylesterase